MADQCTDDLPGSIVESFALAIEVVKSQVKNSPTTIAKILNDPEVQKKIKESLEKRLFDLQAKSKVGRPIDSQQALEEVKSVFTVDSMDLITKNVKSTVERSYSFQKLQDSLRGLSCKFKESPLGAFYDEREGVLLILAVGVMVGGVVGMYIAKTGDADTPLSLVSKLAELPSITVLGKIDLGLADVVLKPSEKKYDGGLYAKMGSLGPLKDVQLKVVVQTKDEKVAAVPITVQTKINVTKGWMSTVGATYDPLSKGTQFSMGITGNPAGDSISVQLKANLTLSENKDSYGGTGNVTWKPVPGVGVTAGAGVSRVFERMPDTGAQTSKTDVNVNVGLRFDL